MSKINDYYQKKQLMEKLSEELAHLENDESLKADLEFEDQIKELMGEYEKNSRDVLQILSAIDPMISQSGSVPHAIRAKRPLKVYKNPHTGEVVETRGGNHKTLNEWRQKWGKDEVFRWVAED